MQAESSDPKELVSILSARLAVESAGPIPSIDSLGLASGKQACFEWQQRRSHASWNDLHAALSGRHAGDWTLELHGILGVAAEQVLLAIESEVEKSITQSALDALPSDGANIAKRASYSRSLRFFAEGQANAVVVALHSLANLTLRTIAIDPLFTDQLLKPLQVKPAEFTPGSTGKSAWISFNASTVATLTVAAAACGPESLALAERLAALGDEKAIADLLALRNVQYHRWRGETPGVTGIDLGSRSTRERLAAGEVVGISAQMLPDYVGGQLALDELVQVARSALDSLIGHMTPFHDSWYAAFRAAFPD